jgi:GTP-binding protein Era
MRHKAGFVTILGLPNAGKSSLLNALVQEKLAAVSPKAQTTRHRIPAIINGEDYQIVLSDTPGLIDKAAYALHERMMGFIREALEDSDFFLLVYDVSVPPAHHPVIESMRSHFTPDNSLLVLNKWDKGNPEYAAALQKAWPGFYSVRTSVVTGEGISEVLDWIKQRLPEHPPYFDKESLSSLSMRFFVSEIIREKIFFLYRDEIPYACHVEVDSYKEDPDMHRISAIIYVEKESQKGILIGRGGEALKKLGILAREEIEALTGQKVFLSLSVKVADGWRKNERFLKKFGYISGL